MSADDLIAQRRFLLDSIRDLEREHAVGDVTDDDYRALRDGYIARAAAVLREIDGNRRPTIAPQRRRSRSALIVLLTLCIAVALGVVVARSAGQRLPGQSLTGGQPADEVAIAMAEGRRLLNLGHLDDALALYQRALQLEPDNVEAVTYTAWVGILVADRDGDVSGVQAGLQRLAAATTLDVTYADPHCLLALALHSIAGDNDALLVQQEAEACLELNPPADVVPLIEAIRSAA